MATQRLTYAFDDAVVCSVTYNDGSLAIAQVGVTLPAGRSVTIRVTDGAQVFTQTLTSASTTWNVTSAHLSMVRLANGRLIPPAEWTFTIG